MRHSATKAARGFTSGGVQVRCRGRHMDRGMLWVRTNRRIGAAVALFALAVQLALSFGHVHLDNAAPQTASGGDAPPDPDRRPGATDFCAICATLSLASTLLLPEPSRFTPPIAHSHAWSREFE